jgi:type I restriction enzyme S subunit
MKFRWETEFKETEIGEIPKDWEIMKLDEILVKIIKGKNPKKYLGDLPYLTAKYLRGEAEAEEFYDKAAGVLVDENEIIVIWDGSNSGEVFKSKRGILASTMCKLLFNEKVINKTYAFFVLKTNEEDIKYAKSGTDDRHVDKEYFLNFLIPLPPLAEQSRIATVLSYFDDLIEVKKRQNEILEKTAMAIFKSWFIDFEPFRDGEFVYSEELGKEIPKGWEVSKTTRLIEYNHFFSLKKSEAYPFIEMKDVSSNSLVCEYNFKQFSGSGVKYYGGDTLMARITPSLEHGKTAFVWFISEKEKGFGSTEFFVLHPKEPYLKEFVYLLAKNDDFREAAINSMSGTSGRQRADINALKDYIIPIPPPHILQSFHSLVEPLFQKIILNQKQIMTIRKIRDTLLPLLVFGKLRVEEL